MITTLKTRIAPTPSGYLHLGNCFSFILTALVAKLRKGRLLLRIDDIDKARYRPEYAEDIFRTLDFLGIAWDEGPEDMHSFQEYWSQHARIDLYETALEALWQKERLYACTCSRREWEKRGEAARTLPCCLSSALDKDKTGYSWRVLTDERKVKLFSAGNGELSTALPDEMHQMILRRRDGLPAYQLTSLLDDLHFKCNFLVRGSDLFPSSVAQLFLAELLEEKTFKNAVFFHHALVKEKDGHKFSKTNSAPPVKAWRQKPNGKIRVFFAISAWLKLEEPVGSMEELVSVMSEDRLLALDLTAKMDCFE